MVVLGNPPYSGHSANKGKWITGLLKGYDGITGQNTDNYFLCDGEPLGEKNPKWLNDDYVKFIRFAQWRIKQTGHGILAFITNHGFLDNPTFRGMRRSLIKSFDELYLLDLHGNSKKKEQCPDGSKDENVFDIQQGVSICFFIRKSGEHEREAKIYRADLFGLRGQKYSWLQGNDIKSVSWKSVDASAQFYLFSAGQDRNLQEEFNQSWKLTEMFPVHVLGFQTHRDHFSIAHTEKEMMDRLLDLRDDRVEDSELYSKYKLKDNRDWKLASARKSIRNDKNWKDGLVECCYRPFDNRCGYLSYVMMDYPRRELLQHVSGKDNLCILVSRQQETPGFRHSWITKLPAESCAVSTKTKEQNYVFPLYLHHSRPLDEAAGITQKKEANINQKLIAQLEKTWGLEFQDKRDGNQSFTPEDIAYFTYGVMNSSSYRERYCDLLKTDFPRIPFPKDSGVFFAVSELGKALSDFHMLKNIEEADIDFPVKGSNKIEKIRYIENKKKLYINKEQYFTKIASEIWEYKIGGYDFVSKWLKDRPNNEISYSDIKAFRKIVSSCLQTIETVKAIDKVIAKAGGWKMAVISHEETTNGHASQDKILKKPRYCWKRRS